MVEFWAERINYDLEEVDKQVPNKLREKVRAFIIEYNAEK